MIWAVGAYGADEAALGAHPLAQLALGGLLDEVQRQESHQNQQHIADPRIETRQSQLIQDVGVMNQIPHIEVEQVETIAGLAHEDERTHAESAGQRVLSCETEDNAAEERHQAGHRGAGRRER